MIKIVIWIVNFRGRVSKNAKKGSLRIIYENRINFFRRNQSFTKF